VRVAVITLVAGRHQHLRLQCRALAAGTLRPDLYVVVSMNDRSAREVLDGAEPPPDVVEMSCAADRLPLAQARNMGARHALRAGAGLLVFLDVDCAPGARLVQRYTERAVRAERPELLCGPVAYLPPPPGSGYDLSSLPDLGRPHPGRPVPSETGVLGGGDHTLFWSLSFAVRAGLWQRLGGFCEEYAGYGGEDTDFGQVAASRGVPLTWVGGAWAYHQYHPTSDPPRQHAADIVRNAALFHRRWGWWPMGGWLREFEREGLARFEPDTRSWALAQLRSRPLARIRRAETHPVPGDGCAAPRRG
jgi:GT2 family glycosyltransferase